MRRRLEDVPRGGFGGIPARHTIPGAARDSALGARYEALGGAVLLGEPLERRFGRVWIALGAEAWGTPGTEELPTPDGVGWLTRFNGGTASICWSCGAGAPTGWS